MVVGHISVTFEAINLTLITLCRKLLKVFQYAFVIFAEYNVMRHFLKLRDRKCPSPEVVKDWYTRLRKMGSGISTTRMALRLVQWLSGIKFLVAQV